jgi:hypothetical protein
MSHGWDVFWINAPPHNCNRWRCIVDRDALVKKHQ